MKKSSAKSADKEIQAEYDFASGLRGKYSHRYQRDANVVMLEPDVAKAFHNANALNDSLRALAHIIQRQGKDLAGKILRCAKLGATDLKP